MRRGDIAEVFWGGEGLCGGGGDGDGGGKREGGREGIWLTESREKEGDEWGERMVCGAFRFEMKRKGGVFVRVNTCVFSVRNFFATTPPYIRTVGMGGTQLVCHDLLYLSFPLDIVFFRHRTR